MNDLNYILGIGFSGADIWRALWIAFFLAMLLGKKHSAWLIALIGLLIDRIVWPITGMAISGADIQSIYASIGAMASTFLDDLGVYAVRYVGLAILIATFIGLRTRIHNLQPAKA